MEFERTKDILDHARAFHSRLESLYESLSESAQRERVRLLLNYLSRHEKHVSRQLARYEEHAAGRVLDTWFQYVPEEDIMRRFREVELNPDMTVEEVITNALVLDQCLIDLFRESANRTMSREVKDVLQNLLELEEEEQLRLKRSALDAGVL